MSKVLACLSLAVIGRPGSAITTADLVYAYNNDIVSWLSAIKNLPPTWHLLPRESQSYRGHGRLDEMALCRYVQKNLLTNDETQLQPLFYRGVFQLASFVNLSKIVLSTDTSMETVLSNYMKEFSLPSGLCGDIVAAAKSSQLLSIQVCPRI